jgi:putative transposase
VYPYLLERLSIERTNQVWASDITYLLMAHGFLYLVAILDIASRKVPAFKLSKSVSGSPRNMRRYTNTPIATASRRDSG